MNCVWGFVTLGSDSGHDDADGGGVVILEGGRGPVMLVVDIFVVWCKQREGLGLVVLLDGW